MNTDWDLLMNEIRTIEKTEYTLEYYGNNPYPYLCRPSHYHIPDGDSLIMRDMLINTHKEKKEYLKINKIKGYSKCTNHQQLNKLLMSF